MKLDDEETEKGLQLVPETYGMDAPNACTVVIITGKWPNKYKQTNGMLDKAQLHRLRKALRKTVNVFSNTNLCKNKNLKWEY